METVEEKIERLKGKAKILQKNGEKVFLKDIQKNYYFCYIQSIEEDHIVVYNFKGKREDTISKIIWYDVLELNEYKPREGEDDY